MTHVNALFITSHGMIKWNNYCNRTVRGYEKWHSSIVWRTAAWRQLQGDFKWIAFPKRQAPMRFTQLTSERRWKHHDTALLYSSAAQRKKQQLCVPHKTQHCWACLVPPETHVCQTFSSLHSTAFKLLTHPTQLPFLARLISLRNTKKEAGKRSFSGKKGQTICLQGLRCGIPTTGWIQGHRW